MVCTACLACFISTVNGHSKIKVENALEDVALVAGTQQNLSNLLFFRYLWLPLAKEPGKVHPLFLSNVFLLNGAYKL
jgi:hypothetical protein